MQRWVNWGGGVYGCKKKKEHSFIMCTKIINYIKTHTVDSFILDRLGINSEPKDKLWALNQTRSTEKSVRSFVFAVDGRAIKKSGLTPPFHNSRRPRPDIQLSRGKFTLCVCVCVLKARKWWAGKGWVSSDHQWLEILSHVISSVSLLIILMAKWSFLTPGGAGGAHA